ncbi:CPBP family intramembrane glutamic endopeptidase [Actinoplanes awajinensis]|uniref:CPBP family intramembrane glutamic endopeptidase n=1 Tax=Actinoplanes awajinensis TaxID=135946 RepID=UPI0009FF8A43|nr:CPBP family intramembrane glutamic endopeptidase [Actinoplanes awajinensis]
MPIPSRALPPPPAVALPTAAPVPLTATPVPLTGHPSGRRLALVFGAVLVILAAVNVADKYGPHHTGLVAGPVVALALVLISRRAGLTWHDLGLSRRTFLPGVKWAVGAVALVAVVYTIGAAIPATRIAFHDVRYHLHPGAALLTAFVVVPLGTVLLEEVAFRGVLLGLVNRHRGATWASITSSVLFGLWHILPSLRLAQVNAAVGATLGSGPLGSVLAVLAAVGFTALAGLLLCELRRRSGSLLAAAALHWATNGLGLLIATALATTSLT